MNNIAQYGNHFELIRAIEEHNLAVVQWLVRSPHCVINATHEGGQTPLHQACGNIFGDCLETLFQHGADPNLQDDRGKTPLHYVASDPLIVEMIQPLLNNGTNLALTDHDGQTVLHIAAAGGESKNIRLLIQHGAQIDARDSIQRTPLHNAAKSWWVESVMHLLEAGADLHAVDEDGNSPLHLAATKNCPEITSALLNAGAKPDVCNHAGQCPLELSVGRTSGSGVGAAVVLLQRGAATTQSMLDKLLKNTIRRAASMPHSRQLVETLLQCKASPTVLTDRDFLFLLARDKQVIRFDKSIGLTQEALGVLHLLSKHRTLPPRVIAELL